MTPEHLNLNQYDLESIVKRFFGNSKLQFQIKQTTVSPFGSSRVGYLGDHFNLCILVELQQDDKCQEQWLKLFYKRLSAGIPALTDYLQAIGTSRKEARLYTELLHKLARFSRFAPKAYLAKDDRVLVFENVALEGFRTLDSDCLGIFDLPHLEQALKALARFHSACLMVETKKGRTVPELCPKGVLEENCWIRKENNPRVEELENAIEVLCELVKEVEKDNKNLAQILNKLPDFMLQIYELVKPSSAYRNVICHGDLWAGNLMFRYSDEGVPVDCLIVDYQFARYAPPAYDVHMLITLTTTGEFRKQHYQSLIEFYYQAVWQEFIAQCLSPGEIFPKKQFMESCERYRISGLIDNFLMNHVTLLPRRYVDKIFSSPEEYNNFSGTDKIWMCLEVINTDERYRERLSGIIRDLIEAI